jgi:hypothetical protein
MKNFLKFAYCLDDSGMVNSNSSGFKPMQVYEAFVRILAVTVTELPNGVRYSRWEGGACFKSLFYCVQGLSLCCT